MTEHITVSRELLRKVLEPIERATETAMHQTLVARIPESGLFSGIAQDLNWAATELRAALEQPAVEHSEKDRRCECCGYMTYHREHLGCIRAAPQAQQPAPADVPLLTNEEIGKALGFGEYTTDSTRATMTGIAHAIEQAVRQKAGLK